jgi:uncharacterized protein (DUF58 family)
MKPVASAPLPSLRLRERFLASRLGQYASKLVFQPRGPEGGEVFLNQRRVFALPTSAGLLFGVMLVALLLGSINYNLSLGFGLTFLMASIAWIGMFYTFRNLAHLRLRGARVDPIYAGEIAQFHVVLVNRSRFDRYAIRLIADTELAPVYANASARGEASVAVPVRITRRGWQAMPRITFETRFPLGLWRTWAYWQPALRVLAYPTPGAPGVPLPVTQTDGSEGAGHGGPGSEDYAGIRRYTPGDSVRHLAWKAMARAPSGEVLTKVFDGGGRRELWLELAVLPPHLDLEVALSRLTRWVLDCESGDIRYGLRLGAVTIEPDHGEAHCEHCLTALAIYGHASRPV